MNEEKVQTQEMFHYSNFSTFEQLNENQINLLCEVINKMIQTGREDVI